MPLNMGTHLAVLHPPLPSRLGVIISSCSASCGPAAGVPACVTEGWWCCQQKFLWLRQWPMRPWRPHSIRPFCFSVSSLHPTVAERGQGEEKAWRPLGCSAGATGGVHCRATKVLGTWRWDFQIEDGKAHGGLLSLASSCLSYRMGGWRWSQTHPRVAQRIAADSGDSRQACRTDLIVAVGSSGESLGWRLCRCFYPISWFPCTSSSVKAVEITTSVKESREVLSFPLWWLNDKQPANRNCADCCWKEDNKAGCKGVSGEGLLCLCCRGDSRSQGAPFSCVVPVLCFDSRWKKRYGRQYRLLKRPLVSWGKVSSLH